jgi:hypothetical protein
LQERDIEGEDDCFGEALEEVQAQLTVWEEPQAKLYLRFLYSSVLAVVIPPWRSVGTDLSVVITCVGLGFCAAVPNALEFLCTCQLDLARQAESLDK